MSKNNELKCYADITRPMDGALGMILHYNSHYELTIDDLVELYQWKMTDAKDCLEYGEDTNSKADAKVLSSALATLVASDADTLSVLLDANPNKTDEQIYEEYAMGIKTGGVLFEVINEAVASEERIDKAWDWALYHLCPICQIDFNDEVKRALRLRLNR